MPGGIEWDMGVAHPNVRPSTLGKKPFYPGKERYLGTQVWGPLGDPRELVVPPPAESLRIAPGAAELREGIQTGEPGVASLSTAHCMNKGRLGSPGAMASVEVYPGGQRESLLAEPSSR